MKRIALILASSYICLMVFAAMALLALETMQLVTLSDGMSFIILLILILAMVGSIITIIANIVE